MNPSTRTIIAKSLVGRLRITDEIDLLFFSKMYFISILIGLVLLATSIALPIEKENEAYILSFENTNDGTGNYYFKYKTSNNIVREEKGEVVNAGQVDEHISVTGSFSYINPDGIAENVYYTADDKGYKLTKSVPTVLPPALIVPFTSASVVASLLGK